MSRGGLSRKCCNIFTSPHKFDHHQGEIGESHRVSCFSLGKELLQGSRIRLIRKFEPMFISKFYNSLPSFRSAHYTSDRREFFRREVPCGYAVSPYHEILDNVFCPVPFF